MLKSGLNNFHSFHFEEIMASERTKRAGVYLALCAGKTPSEIVNFLNVPRSLVYRIKQAFDNFDGPEEEKETFCVERKTKDAHKPVRDATFVDDVRGTIENDPRKSMRAIAREKGVSDGTVRRVVRDDLNLKSYALRRAQFLSKEQVEKRFVRASALLNDMKHDTSGYLRFFSDEKIFTQQQKVNRRNDRYLTDDAEEVPVVMSVKFPANVMVLGVVSSEGDVMPPHIFEKGIRVNSEVYIDVLKKVVKPWMDRVAGGRPYVFQQDSAPSHASKMTQAWLLENIHHHWSPDLWPPNSPDLNPLDYFVWGVLESKINSVHHPDLDSLKASIGQQFALLDNQAVSRACKAFRTRVDKVVASNGAVISKINKPMVCTCSISC